LNPGCLPRSRTAYIQHTPTLWSYETRKMFPKRTKSSAVGPPRSNYPANAEHELDHAYVYNTPSNFPTSRLVGSSNYLQHNLKTKFPYQTMTSFQDAVNFANSKRGKGNSSSCTPTSKLAVSVAIPHPNLECSTSKIRLSGTPGQIYQTCHRLKHRLSTYNSYNNGSAKLSLRRSENLTLNSQSAELDLG
jgi:hypothetical protein